MKMDFQRIDTEPTNPFEQDFFLFFLIIFLRSSTLCKFQLRNILKVREKYSMSLYLKCDE